MDHGLAAAIAAGSLLSFLLIVDCKKASKSSRRKSRSYRSYRSYKERDEDTSSSSYDESSSRSRSTAPKAPPPAKQPVVTKVRMRDLADESILSRSNLQGSDIDMEDSDQIQSGAKKLPTAKLPEEELHSAREMQEELEEHTAKDASLREEGTPLAASAPGSPYPTAIKLDTHDDPATPTQPLTPTPSLHSADVAPKSEGRQDELQPTMSDTRLEPSPTAKTASESRAEESTVPKRQDEPAAPKSEIRTEISESAPSSLMK